jgi:CheY-like chemotaxis protein
MSLLVEDLLDLSAIEVGVLKVDPVPCDIHQAFVEIGAEWQKTAVAKGLWFETRIAPAVPQFVLVDIARLRQCINNLLSNAIRFTERGTVSLHLDQHPAGLELTVSDTGPGLPSGVEERLFRPYQQFSENKALRHGGSGLGLAISHGLARSMRGDLRLDRSYSQGARFRMSFSAPPAQMPPKPVLANKDALRGRSVLVVDDVATNRLVIRLLLEPLGVKVIEAASGKAVLHNKDLAQVDLVLLDIHMPDLSGHDTLDLMRISGLVAPIVALSADAHFTQREAAFRNGFADYLTKPIELEALVETIQKVIKP